MVATMVDNEMALLVDEITIVDNEMALLVDKMTILVDIIDDDEDG